MAKRRGRMPPEAVAYCTAARRVFDIVDELYKVGKLISKASIEVTKNGGGEHLDTKHLDELIRCFESKPYELLRVLQHTAAGEMLAFSLPDPPGTEQSPPH